MPRRIKEVLKAKGVQPGTRNVYLIKWPVSVCVCVCVCVCMYVYIYIYIYIYINNYIENHCSMILYEVCIHTHTHTHTHTEGVANRIRLCNYFCSQRKAAFL